MELSAIRKESIDTIILPKLFINFELNLQTIFRNFNSHDK